MMDTKKGRLDSSAPRLLRFNSTTVPIRFYKSTIHTPIPCQSELPRLYAFSEEGPATTSEFDGPHDADRGGTRFPWTLSPTTDATAYSREWDRDSAR